jgi:hypothetical protein
VGAMIVRSIAGSCWHCSKTFEVSYAGIGRVPRFCSAECRTARRDARRRRYMEEGRYPTRRDQPRRDRPRRKICAVCSKQFETMCSRTQCCGVNCGRVLAKRKSALRTANMRLRRTRSCENCGENFVARNPSGRARRGETHEGRFCSRACFGEFRRKSGTGGVAAS